MVHVQLAVSVAWLGISLGVWLARWMLGVRCGGRKTHRTHHATAAVHGSVQPISQQQRPCSYSPTNLTMTQLDRALMGQERIGVWDGEPLLRNGISKGLHHHLDWRIFPIPERLFCTYMGDGRGRDVGDDGIEGENRDEAMVGVSIPFCAKWRRR